MLNENDIAKDPTTSRWLKELIENTKERDVVDTLNDIEVLQQILEQRLNNLITSLNESKSN